MEEVTIIGSGPAAHTFILTLESGEAGSGCLAAFECEDFLTKN